MVVQLRDRTGGNLSGYVFEELTCLSSFPPHGTYVLTLAASGGWGGAVVRGASTTIPSSSWIYAGSALLSGALVWVQAVAKKKRSIDIKRHIIVVLGVHKD